MIFLFIGLIALEDLSMCLKTYLPLILAIVVSLFLPAMAKGASSAWLGTALQAYDASVNRENVPEGTNIYSEDSLETGASGVMRVEFGDSQLYLGSSTGVVVHRIGERFSLDVRCGTAVISAAATRSVQVEVDGTTIRPVGEHSTSAQIIWVSPQEFLLKSDHGDLEITLGNERKTVGSGLSYRVSIVPRDSASSDDPLPGPDPGVGASPAGKMRLSKIIFGAVVIGATAGVLHVLVSPSVP
jgi:hypothetical protein